MVDVIPTDEKGRFDGRYLLIRPLNTDGATADVWLSLDLNTVSNENLDKLDEIVRLSDDEIEKFGLMVAIKIYRPQNALDIEGEQRFRDEYMIVFNCHHANLIHPVNFSIYKDTPYLVLPYCKRGSSELLIGSFVNDDDMWRYIRDVAAGLNYLHHNNPPIIHQDIKPANVLIDENDNYAITDFGISAKRMKQYNGQSENYDYEEQSGTFAYMAPERFIEGNIPSAESDIWALGATLYELLTGRVPFGEDGGLVQPDGKVSLPLKDIKISDDIKCLICACLSKNPSERPTAEQLLNVSNQKRFKAVKNSTPVGKVFGILCALIAIGLGSWYLLSHQTTGSKQKPEDLFQDALLWVDASTIDSVRIGIEKLDTLAKLNYVPAQLELAKTIGPNFIDPLDLQKVTNRRKDFLQIATRDIDGISWPLDLDFINRCQGIYTQILQRLDSSSNTDKALAAFSLAKINDRLCSGKELTDSIAIIILDYYNMAIKCSGHVKGHEYNLFRQERDVFVHEVIEKYNYNIMVAIDNNDKERENVLTQYMKSFKAALDGNQH